MAGDCAGHSPGDGGVMMKGEYFRISAAIVAAVLLGVSGGMFPFPKPQAAFAFDPNEHSGENQYPERATDVKPRDDERWVNYDRGDQTDWLKIKTNASPEQQLVTTIEFTRIEGTLLLEVFQNDPYATPIEGYEISAPQVYHIVNRGKNDGNAFADADIHAVFDKHACSARN